MVALRMMPGQASELRAAPDLLAVVRDMGPVGAVICDRGYSSQRWRQAIEAAGARAVVPAQPTHRNAPRHDRARYARRHRVENLWARLKEWRAIATRYDKTAPSFEGAIYLAAAIDWLPNRP